jgi:hypothetical protein
MADPTAIPTADAHADEATGRIAELIKTATKPAAKLTGYTNGAGLDVTKLAMHGTPDQLDAWRDTRTEDAELQMLVARWRELWNLAVRSNRAHLVNVAPRGLDLYGWEAPEECDHPQVRLGADVTQRDGQRHTTLVHVDLIRIAHQPTPFRLLGPTAALDLIGPDGITQDGHPLRSGTTHGSPHYLPTEPTWIADRPEPAPPSHHSWDPAANARAIIQQQHEAEALHTGGVR